MDLEELLFRLGWRQCSSSKASTVNCSSPNHRSWRLAVVREEPGVLHYLGGAGRGLASCRRRIDDVLAGDDLGSHPISVSG